MSQKKITVALDGTGGDRSGDINRSVVNAVRFALTLYPSLYLIVFGPSELETELKKATIDQHRVDFRLAPQGIPQDETPRAVLQGYRRAAMRLAVQTVVDKEADAVVSGGGTGPLVALSRHLLGTLARLRPALCAKIPGGPGRFSMMLDLGANATSTAGDLYDFARLGTAASRLLLGVSDPRVSVLNVGSEQGKGSALIRHARDLIKADRSLDGEGFVEANRLFCGDTDVIVTDGFTGNVALKAAEGVAHIFAHGPGLKRFFAKMACPDWLQPWQYNGSLLLGVNGVVVKSHASAGEEALAVAMVEAANAASCDLLEGMKETLLK